VRLWRQKVHWNRLPFLCQLTVTVVLVISEALYFIPAEDCVNKLLYISYLILRVLKYYFMVFVLTGFFAVRCSNENLDSVKSAYADLIAERRKYIFFS